MSLMYTAAELAAMWDIKQVFDPGCLLNPGKVFPLPTPGDAVGEQITAVQATREGDDEGALADTLNGGVFSPTTAEEAAEVLLAATRAHRSVYIRGSAKASTKHDAAMLLSTTALKGIKTYAPDDLYITVGAGTPLSEIQSFLASERKQVPLATPWQEATIGGLVAANLNAPLRMRYGSIRDLVLYVTVVLADGRVIRTGRPVIKNVAGYDLTKVFIGSHGTLGLITDVTLKIAVQPRAQRTLLLPLDDLRHGLARARKLLPLALIASAIVLCKGCTIPGMPQSAYILAYTAEGVPEDVQAELDQVRQALRTAGGPEPIEVESPSGTAIWSALLGNNEGKLQVRVGVAAKDVATYVNDQAATLNAGTFLADMSSGLVYAMTPSDNVDEARERLERLRQPALAIDGYAVVMDMPEAWQGVIDRWGYSPQAIDLMRGLKERWDPRGVLNPGMFIL
jgi:FAD/FMN-containing dehydrogenase